MTAQLVGRQHEFQYTVPKPATFEVCEKASTCEACKRYRLDNLRLREVTVNGKHRNAEASEKLTSNSKLCYEYSPSPGVQTGFVDL